MVSRLTCVWLCWLLLAALPAQAATLSAAVDRKAISEDDTLTLMVRYSDSAGLKKPDFSALQQDFRILQNRSASQITLRGAYTEWQLRLAPKRTGTLTIPAFSFAGSRTQPIEIQVAALSAAAKQKLAEDFFFKIEVSQGPAYVQGQILYHEKLFYRVMPEDPSLSDFRVTDARVEPLGDVRSYQVNIDGERLGVYERNFAIFPEQSGELVIPGQRFSARVPNPYDRWSSGRQINLTSKPIRLEVKAIPDTYPQAPWLPANRLKISETFSRDNQQPWVQGEPVTRTIRIEAEGLAGSQIPAVALPVVDKLRYYPDRSEHSDQIDKNGITGVLEQSLAIVPTSDGRLILPEIRIPWWNTRLGSIEYAVLPARTIDVSASQAAAIPASTANNTRASAAAAPAGGQGIWVLISALLLLSNFVLGFLLWNSKQQTDSQPDKTPRDDHDEKYYWKALQQAARQNDAGRFRHALIHWAQLHLQQPQLITLEQISQSCNEPQLIQGLRQLDNSLYAAEPGDTPDLASLLKSLKQLTADDRQPAPGLASLYS